MRIRKFVKNTICKIVQDCIEINKWRKFQRAVQSGMLLMGQGTYGRPEVISFEGDKGKVVIGNYCSIADGVKIFVGGNPKETHNIDYISTFPFLEIYEWESDSTLPVQKGSGVTIGHDVWIGMDVFIMHGVNIGNGSVIATRSVVTKDIPSYSIAAGNPCKVIRKRFDDETIELLTSLQWWNWDLNKIKKEINFIYNVANKNSIKEHLSVMQCLQA
jgi:acyl-[acyl carrier protein]--UDP-N-acetylglucosamine O-acyltransferase